MNSYSRLCSGVESLWREKPVWAAEMESLEPRLLLDGTEPLAADGVEQLDLSPPMFVENAGHWTDAAIRYAFQGGGGRVGAADDGMLFTVAGPDGGEAIQFRSRFVGANAVAPTGIDVQPTAYNFFVGDSATWRSGVSGFAGVAYANVWDGIDLHVFGGAADLKQEFLVAPGADWGGIAIAWEGADPLTIDAEGNLEITTAAGVLEDAAPVIWQEIDGQRIFIEGEFRLIDADTYGFSITGAYHPALSLTIDPDLEWAVYVGGDAEDSGTDVALDSLGNAYVVGTTLDQFAPGGATQDAFVAKVGTDPYMTLLGGTGYDKGFGIAVDDDGVAYVTGSTQSPNWPAEGSGTDQHAFVVKLNAGGGLDDSTSLGEIDTHVGNGIAVTGTGEDAKVFVTGISILDSIPLPGEHEDAFVAKLDWDLNILASTYLGGPNDDQGMAIAVSGTDVFVAGGDQFCGLGVRGPRRLRRARRPGRRCLRRRLRGQAGRRPHRLGVLHLRRRKHQYQWRPPHWQRAGGRPRILRQGVRDWLHLLLRSAWHTCGGARRAARCLRGEAQRRRDRVRVRHLPGR